MNNSAKACVWQHPLLRSPRAARMRPTFDPPPALCLQNCLGTTAYDIGNVFRPEVSKRSFWGFFFQKERSGFYFSSDTFIAFKLIQFWWKAETCPCGFHDLVKAPRWSRAWGAESPQSSRRSRRCQVRLQHGRLLVPTACWEPAALSAPAPLGSCRQQFCGGKGLVASFQPRGCGGAISPPPGDGRGWRNAVGLSSS